MFLAVLTTGALFPNFGITSSALLIGAAIGVLIGLLWVRKYWKQQLDDWETSFLKLDDTHLEIKGPTANGLLHVRFQIDEILDARLGNKSLTSGLNRLLAFINATMLVIQEKNGKTMRFNLVGILYRNEDLQKFFEALELAMHQIQSRKIP